MVIGLTGGMGTGKSTAAKYLTANGFAHIDADAIARELTVKGSLLLPRLEETFAHKGSIIREDGTLDRKGLAAIVFADAREKELLDEIMLVAIIDVIDERVASLRNKAGTGSRPQAVIIDAPLLFEADMDKGCDKTILIVADEDVRIRRVCERDGATPGEVRARMKSQMSDADKMERADFVVDNSSDLNNLHRQLDDIIKNVMK